MRKSKSWTPSRSGAAGADAPEDGEGCCGEPDTPRVGDSCAINENELSCKAASTQIDGDFIGLTRMSSVTCRRTITRKADAGGIDSFYFGFRYNQIDAMTIESPNM